MKTSKQIFDEIIDLETKEYGSGPKSHFYTIIEYYKSDIFKKRIKLSRKHILGSILAPFFWGGFHVNICNSNNVVVFNSLPKIFSNVPKNSLIAFVAYHECRHYYQSKDNGLVGFLFDMEKRISSFSSEKYWINHDLYFMEMEASFYASVKSLEYFSKNNILDEKSKCYFEMQRMINEIYLYNFNPLIIMNKYNELVKNGKFGFYEDGIYNSDGTLKDPKYILNNNQFKDLCNEIKYLIISSTSFLDQLDIDKLDFNERQIVIEALTFAKDIGLRIQNPKYPNIKKYPDIKKYILHPPDLMCYFIGNVEKQIKQNMKNPIDGRIYDFLEQLIQYQKNI